MIKYITAVLMIIGLSEFTQAQDYKTALGFRGGLSPGLTVRHNMGDSKSLEGILSARWGGWNITGLLEFNMPIDVDGLTWFYGGGAHLGFWDASDNRNWFDLDKTGPQTVIGVDGIIGLEFTIPNAPINFQLDYKPGFNLIGHNGWWGDEAAVSIRYTIK